MTGRAVWLALAVMALPGAPEAAQDGASVTKPRAADPRA